jgi:hypothetical protein
VFRSVQELEQSIQNFLNVWNAQPTPFVWTPSVEKIIEKVARCRRRLEQVQPGCTQSKHSANEWLFAGHYTRRSKVGSWRLKPVFQPENPFFCPKQSRIAAVHAGMLCLATKILA